MISCRSPKKRKKKKEYSKLSTRRSHWETLLTYINDGRESISLLTKWNYIDRRVLFALCPVSVDPAHGFYEAALLSSRLPRIARNRSGRRIGRVKPIKCDQSDGRVRCITRRVRVPINKLNVAISWGWFT